jgi:hypothetical protein
VVVTVLNDVHDCTSSGRRKTTTPSSNWVAYRALPILMSEPDLGVKSRKRRLQEKYNVQRDYKRSINTTQIDTITTTQHNIWPSESIL